MKPKTITAFLFLCLSVLSAHTKQISKPKPLAIIHVTVIDATGKSAMSEMTVIINGDRISEIGKSDQVRVPKGSRVVDGKGKFLIPGLWDMHGHLTNAGEGAFRELIANGITGVRDLGGDLAQVDKWIDEIARGTRVGPHIFRAGPFLDGPNPGVPYRITVTNATEGREAVRLLKKKGVDFIKVHHALPREAFFAIADEARKLGLPLAAHLPKGVSVEEASDAGAASLEHAEMLIDSAANTKGSKTVDEALAENSGEKGAAVFSHFVKNGTYYVPTLVAYYRGFAMTGTDHQVERRLALFQRLLPIIGAMHKAGVNILAGSDFSDLDGGVVPGSDLHDELAFLVQAGFTRMEALQAATLNPAKFLHLSDSMGTIEKGKIADLVLLNANPLDNISNTRRIAAVVVKGEYIPQEAR